MDKHEVIGAAQELIRAGGSLVLATVDQDGVPQVRWMGAALLEEPLTVYLVAGAQSRKMGQIKAHPKSQLMFQSADYARVATLSGTCEVVGDRKTKQRVWEGIPGAANFFKGPDDPGFGAIKFVCKGVEMLGLKEGMAPAAAEL
jgi:general stress protein 26